jgi:pilus assembly protein CpaE
MRSLVVSQDAQDAKGVALRNLLLPLVANEEPVNASFDNAEDVFTHTNAELVVVILPETPDKGLAVIDRLRPQVEGHLLVIGKASDPKLFLRALQSGADHYLDEADLEKELEAAFSRLYRKSGNSAPMGRLWAVLSASGGCGASTVAVNLAAALAVIHKHCCLVDLNARRGDLSALLDLKPKFTLADLCRNHARLDRVNFEKMISPHASGIHLLAAPQQFEDVSAIDARGISQTLSFARRYYAHVVVDMEDCFHEEQAVTLRQAARILVICRLDFISLRNARRVLEQFSRLDIAKNRIRLVINQFGQPYELPVDEAEEAIGEKFSCILPNDAKTISVANNMGIPAVQKEPQSKVAQALVQLAQLEFEKNEKAANGFSKRLF